MLRIIYLKAARDDIKSQFEYRGDHSEQSARRYADALTSGLEQLEIFPSIGRPRPELADDLRSLGINAIGVTVYYHLKGENVITVSRVIRQERDVTRSDFG